MNEQVHPIFREIINGWAGIPAEAIKESEEIINGDTCTNFR